MLPLVRIYRVGSATINCFFAAFCGVAIFFLAAGKIDYAVSIAVLTVLPTSFLAVGSYRRYKRATQALTCDDHLWFQQQVRLILMRIRIARWAAVAVAAGALVFAICQSTPDLLLPVPLFLATERSLDWLARRTTKVMERPWDDSEKVQT